MEVVKSSKPFSSAPSHSVFSRLDFSNVYDAQLCDHVRGQPKNKAPSSGVNSGVNMQPNPSSNFKRGSNSCLNHS